MKINFNFNNDKNNGIPEIFFDGEKLGIVKFDYLYVTKDNYFNGHNILRAKCLNKHSGRELDITYDLNTKEIEVEQQPMLYSDKLENTVEEQEQVRDEIKYITKPAWFDKWYDSFDGNISRTLHYLHRAGYGKALTFSNGDEVVAFDGGNNINANINKINLAKIILDFPNIKFKEDRFIVRLKGSHMLSLGESKTFIKKNKSNHLFVLVNSSKADALTEKEWNDNKITREDYEFISI